MKFRIIKKDIDNLQHRLLEGTPNQLAPADVAANAGNNNTPTEFDQFTAIAARQFILERKKASLPLDITIPNDFNNQLDMPNAPLDILVIMSTVLINKARKTRDLEKWGMVDPISTYNNAEDCCQKAFESFFQGPITLAQNKKEMNANKQDVMNNNSNESLAYESVSYDYYKPLNEGAALAGYLTGKAAGSALASGISFLGAAGAAAAIQITPAVATILVSTDLIGKGMQKAFGDTDRNDRNTNDNAAAHLNGPAIARSVGSMAMQYGDVVSAFDNYIRRMVQASRELMSGISPNLAKTYSNEFAKFVINVQGVLSKDAEKFIQDNSKYLQDLKKQLEENRLNRNNKELNKVKMVGEFKAALSNYVMGTNDIALFKDAIAAGNYFERNYNSEKGNKLLDAYLDGTPKDVIELYRKLVPKNTPSGSTPENSGYNPQNLSSTSTLNEEDTVSTEDGKRISLDLDKYYRTLVTELTNRIDMVLDEFDPKLMTNLAETKQTMEDLIKAADETIKNKIQIITKVNSSPQASQQSGLGKAAIEFLAGHPVEANNLTEIWSRHLGDLKMRMNNRLKIMTDYNNPVRTLGWTFTMLRTVLPEFFARMLTYRYAYAVLSNEGVYSYDTAQAEADLQVFNSVDPSTGQSISDQYISSARAQILFILNNYSGDYTEDGKSCIVIDENGGYKLSGNTIRYGSLLFNLMNNRLSSDDKMVGGIALANLSNDQDGCEHFINIVYGNMAAVYGNNAQDFDALVNKFRMPDDIKGIKLVILDAYNKIRNEIGQSVIKNISGDDKEKVALAIADSLYIMSLNANSMYQQYLKNSQAIDNAVNEFNRIRVEQNTGKKEEQKEQKDDQKEKQLQKLRDDVHKYFKGINFTNIPKNENNSYVDGIKLLFSSDESNGKNDYYAYILSWYSAKDQLASSLLSGTSLFSVDGIKKVCQMTPSLLKLATSGILTYAMEADKKDASSNIEEQLPEIKNTIIKLYDGVNLINALNGVFVGDNSSNGAGESGIRNLEQIRSQQDNVFQQLQNSYNTKSEAHYTIENLFLLLDRANNLGSELPTIANSGIYSSLTQTNSTNENIINAFNDADIKNNASSGSATIKFSDASTADKNTILNDIYNAIKETREKGDLSKYEVFIDKINKYCEGQQSKKLQK